MSDGSKFQGLGLRVITALALLGPVAAALWYSGWPFTILVVIAGFAMALEWENLLRARSGTGFILAGIVFVLLLAQRLDGNVVSLATLLALIVLSAAVSLLVRRPVSHVAGGLLYVGFPLWTAQWLRDSPDGLFLICFVFLTVWGTDILAMFAGKIIGGPKLAPRISPNKTWAGLVGGMVGAIIGGFLTLGLYVWLTAAEMPSLLRLVVLAALFAVIAQLGDLFESWLKRRNNIKDSGAIIPGHGGVLDRVDGLIGVLIVLGCYMLYALHLTKAAPLAILWGL
jgi:phosphatidate cytidylyltransferase